MKSTYAGFRILLVHAHPDDETINNGATMALYASLGADVTLVTCTRGEEGEVLVPGLSHLASSHQDLLGAHREIELANAMKALGITDYRFLGHYRDSGMMGTDQNNRPDVFWQADLESAARELVNIIEEIKPHVLITYDEIGGYGHPDHIQAHRVAMRASELATWQIQKIYWNTMPKSVIAESIAKMKEIGSDFFGAETAVFNYDRLGNTVKTIAVLMCECTDRSVPRQLDDTVKIGQNTTDDCQAFTQQYKQLCADIGIKLADNCPKFEKAFENSQYGKILGILFDSEDLTWKLPSEKVYKTLFAIDNALKEETISLKTMQKLMGRINDVCLMCPFLHCFKRSLNDDLGFLQRE